MTTRKYKSPLRAQQAKDTRNRILEGAARLTLYNVERVTHAAVARSAGVSERTVFRHFPRKEDLVFLSNRLTIAGLGMLALAMTGAIMLITDVLFGSTATIVTSAMTLLAFVSFWYLLPLRRRVSLEKTERP